MDRIEVPTAEELEGMEQSELEALATSFREAGEELATSDSPTDEDLTLAGEYAEAFDAIGAELAEREVKNEERREAAAALAARFTAHDEAEEAVAADAEAEASAEEADDAEAAAEAEAVEAEEAEEKVLVEASAQAEEFAAKPARKPARKVASLAKRRPAASAPVSENDTARFYGGLRASVDLGGVKAGNMVGTSAIAEEISDLVRTGSYSNLPSGYQSRAVLASSKTQFPESRQLIDGAKETTYRTFRDVQTETTKRRSDQLAKIAAGNEGFHALVAAGGNCAEYQPSYDFFRLAEPKSPVENCLPVVQAPRGGIRYIPYVDWTQALGGVRITTLAEDADGYAADPDGAATGNPGDGTSLPLPATNSTLRKPCVRVQCPAWVDCEVDGISQCVTFGNLNYRTFPEQVDNFMMDLAVVFAREKEIYYLDAIDAASTNVIAGLGFGYGATRDFINDITAAAVAYRKRNRMAPNAPLDIYLPDWVAGFVHVDMVNDASLGLSFINANPEQVVGQFLASKNISACFYSDSATGAGQAFDDPQADGTALNPWPSTVVSYLHSPGTFVRLDGGTLDLGIVRDSQLNGTNDLQIFAEQFIQVCKPGGEALRIEHALCPNGAAPAPAALFVCP